MAGVYISYPFCRQKCTYCNFASAAGAAELERQYRDALRGEILGHRWEWKSETLYLGGGSPSKLAGEELAGLLEPLPATRWREATIEVAPGDVTAEKAREWRHAGLTRVSLGVQSFVAAELRRTGRKHSAQTVAADIALLRREGFAEINIDLIAGLSGQTRRSWDESLDWVERLAPEHVSVYMLEVDQDSRLGREILAGGSRFSAGDVPPEEQVVEFYEAAVERLAAIGLRRYEISNFARPGHESRHNLKYWRLEPYVGFGADAHSFDGAERRRNAETAAEYVERRRRGLSPCVERVPACPGQERFFVGLRLMEGIRPSPDEWGRYEEPIRRFAEAGLLERQGDRLRLTGRGVLVSNEVFQEFVGV